jgi:hypothetical protein
MTSLETIIDVWNTWSAGKEVDKDLVIWCVSIRWWGRIGKGLAVWGAVTLLLDWIGSNKLAAFDKYTTKKLFPRVLRLYARFAVAMLNSILPIVRMTDSMQRFSVALRVAVIFAAIVAVVYLTAWVVAGSGWRDVAGEVVGAFLAMLGIIWHLVILYIQALGLLVIGAQVTFFIPALYVIMLARLLVHRNAKTILRGISLFTIVMGAFLNVLTS